MRLTGKTCEACNQPTHETYSVTAYSGLDPIREHHYCRGCWYYADELTNGEGNAQPASVARAAASLK